MALCRPWIERIDVAVGQTVKGHSGAAGEDHAQEDAGQLKPGKANFIPSQGSTEQSEGEREQGVAEADHFQQGPNAREHELLPSLHSTGERSDPTTRHSRGTPAVIMWRS